MRKKYIPLYTKYRPMVFADITGQESTVKALSNAIKSGRIMHAYLFCGPRGTGKTSSARIFAKSLNCEQGPTVSPCGKCPGCLDVINSTPVDVIEIDAASNRSVEDARNILEKVQYAPLHGKYKIYIIDEVHMLTTEASNTLLKTLEEPPENVIFILATTESHKVLETIVSRCQRYDFRRITTADIVKRLKFIADAENIHITDDALTSVAKNTAGGMRDAVALLDQLSVLGQDRNITTEDVDELLGRISYDKTYDIAECIINSDTEKALQLLNDIHDKGNEPGRILTALIQYFRDMLILKSCTDKNLIFSMTRLNEEIFEKIKEQSEKLDAQTLIYLEDRLSYHFEKIKANTNKYMWTELCIIDLTSSSKIPTIAELSQKVEILENQIASGNITFSNRQIVEIPAVSEKQTNNEPSIKQISEELVVQTFNNENQELKTENLTYQNNSQVNIGSKQQTLEPIELQKNNQTYTDGESDWQQITSEIKGPAKFFYAKIAKLIEINRHKIVLSFSNEGGAKQANDPAKKQLLQQAACKYFDVETIQIDIKVGASEIKKNNDEPHPILTNIQTSKIHKPEFKKEEIKTNPQPHQKIETTTIIESNETNDDDFEEEKSFGFEENINLEDSNNQIDIEQPYVDTLDISDTARNILELFNGKIINS